MTVIERTLPTTAVARNASGLGFRRRIASVAARIASWIAATVDHYATTAMYDQLSRLSDVELQRRGLSRETLAHDIVPPPQ